MDEPPQTAPLPGLIDSHCHLHMDYAPKDAVELVREARAAGVARLITVATDMDSTEKVRQLCQQIPGLYHTVGVSPHDAAGMGHGDLPLLRAAAAHPRCVAVGEIGLDYHYDLSPREVQRLRLEQQLELAVAVGLPVVIHSRDAEPDLLSALARHAGALPAGRPGVLHCFTGSRPFAERCLELGYFISFSGILTFKKAEEVREVARMTPPQRLLVETDSPYLAPVPFRGRRCEPAMVRHTARCLAELRGISEEELCRLTRENTRRLFGLPGEEHETADER